MISQPSPPRGRALARAAGAICLLALLLEPAGASASRSQETIFDATSALFAASPAERKARLNELDSLGVDTVRIVLGWRSVAPSPGRSRRPAGFNPADPRDYPRRAFASLDAIVRGAAVRRMRVLLAPSSPFPDWATRSGRSRLADPIPAELRRLFAALGRRYSGHFRPSQGAASPLPRIRRWSALNEPNQAIFLRPQYRRGRPYSPRLYRRLFLAAQKGLARAGHGNDLLLIGETAPSGGRTGVDPIPFLRGVLCLDASFRRRPGCAPIRAHGWAHHPYSLGLAPFRSSPNPGLVNLAEIGRLHTALRRAAAARATSRRLPVYITEYGVQTRPDRRFGVSLARQVVYLAASEFLAWRDPRIRSYAQYLLHDDPPHFEFSFTTGLRLNSGRAKPSRRSFPITMLVRRVGRRSVRIWGHVRPDQGPFPVEVRQRTGPGPSAMLRRLRTDRRGYFSFRSRYRAGRRWSAESRLPGGRSLAGPYVGALRF